MTEEMRQMSEELKEENKILFDNLSYYLKKSHLSGSQVEEYRRDLLGMALEAQLRGESFAEIIGEDYQGFCDQLIEAGTPETIFQKVVRYGWIISLYSFVVVALMGFEVISSRSYNWNNIEKEFPFNSTSLSYLILFTIMWVCVECYLRYWERKKLSGVKDEVKYLIERTKLRKSRAFQWRNIGFRFIGFFLVFSFQDRFEGLFVMRALDNMHLTFSFLPVFFGSFIAFCVFHLIYKLSRNNIKINTESL